MLETLAGAIALVFGVVIFAGRYEFIPACVLLLISILVLQLLNDMDLKKKGIISMTDVLISQLEIIGEFAFVSAFLLIAFMILKAISRII